MKPLNFICPKCGAKNSLPHALISCPCSVHRDIIEHECDTIERMNKPDGWRMVRGFNMMEDDEREL